MKLVSLFALREKKNLNKKQPGLAFLHCMIVSFSWFLSAGGIICNKCLWNQEKTREKLESARYRFGSQVYYCIGKYLHNRLFSSFMHPYKTVHPCEHTNYNGFCSCNFVLIAKKDGHNTWYFVAYSCDYVHTHAHTQHTGQLLFYMDIQSNNELRQYYKLMIASWCSRPI